MIMTGVDESPLLLFAVGPSESGPHFDPHFDPHSAKSTHHLS